MRQCSRVASLAGCARTSRPRVRRVDPRRATSSSSVKVTSIACLGLECTGQLNVDRFGQTFNYVIVCDEVFDVVQERGPATFLEIVGLSLDDGGREHHPLDQFDYFVAELPEHSGRRVRHRTRRLHRRRAWCCRPIASEEGCRSARSAINSMVARSWSESSSKMRAALRTPVRPLADRRALPPTASDDTQPRHAHTMTDLVELRGKNEDGPRQGIDASA